MITQPMERFEASFPSHYRKGDIAKILSFTTGGKFCQLICLPGNGKATLLKLLANNQGIRSHHLGKNAETTYFLYTNLLELSDFAENNMYTFLLLSFARVQGKIIDEKSLSSDPVMLFQALKDSIDAIANEKKITLILLLDHFDEYQNRLPRVFFQMLRTLKSLAKYRFSVVFATRRDLKDIIDAEIYKEFYDFFVDNTVSVSLYDKSAIDFMLSQIETHFGKTLSPKEKNELILLTGGHAKLLKISAESVLQEGISITQEALLEKPLIQAALFELWHFLTPQEQQALASSVQLDQEDSKYLENIWLLKEGKITIPLFAAFVKTLASKLNNTTITYDEKTKEIKKGTVDISDLLSRQEYKLLRYFVENPNHIIEREEIITTVWPESKNSMGISDQAIDQLIFRLRHKIEDNPNTPMHLQTIKGRGFRFTP